MLLDVVVIHRFFGAGDCVMGGNRLAPGYRFTPTDLELVRYYLKRKILGDDILPSPIDELDIYKFEPRDLPRKTKFHAFF